MGGVAAEKSVSDGVGTARSMVCFGVFGGAEGFHPVVPLVFSVGEERGRGGFAEAGGEC